MAHDVFISHSSRDKVLADATCASLETRSIRCWVAPRDVQAGLTYAGQIKRAINGSRVFVLIFSANANLSENVLREVELAARNGIHILSFRVEDIAVSDDLEYYLSTPHWLDAVTPPLEKHLEQLQKSVQSLLVVSAREVVPPPLQPPVIQTHTSDIIKAADKIATVSETAARQGALQSGAGGIEIPPAEIQREQKLGESPVVPSGAAPAKAALSPPGIVYSAPAQAASTSNAPEPPNKLVRVLKSALASLGGILLLLIADIAVFLVIVSSRNGGVHLENSGAIRVIAAILFLTILGLFFASRFVKSRYLRHLSFTYTGVITITILAILVTATVKLTLQTPPAMTLKVPGVRTACLSLDGKWIVTASKDHTAQIWNAQNGASVGTPFNNGSPLLFANFSPDGTKVVTIAEDDNVRIWDVQTGSLAAQPLRHEKIARIYSAEFSPDGKWLVTAAINWSLTDGAARIWDAQKGKLAGEPFPENGIRSATFSLDGNFIVTTGSSGALVWDVKTRRPLGEPVPMVVPGKAAFSSDGKWITTQDLSYHFRVWDASSHRPAGNSVDCGLAVSVLNDSPADGNWLVIEPVEGASAVWDALNGRVTHRLRHKAFFGLFDDPSESIFVSSAHCTRDGKVIVTVTNDDTVRLWRFD